MKQGLRVVVVSTSYPRWDGDFAGHFVASSVRELARLGHEVTVIAPHAPGAQPTESEEGVTVRRVRYGPDALERLAYGDGIVPNLRSDPLLVFMVPLLAIALRRGLRRESRDADVVHVHWAPTAVLSGAGSCGLPVVLSLHGSDVTLARRGGVWRRLLTDGLKTADAAQVVAKEQKSAVLEGSHYPGRIDVIPSGVSVDLAHRHRPAREPSEMFRMVFVGRLVEEKGILDLLDAFAAALPKIDAVHLEIVGKGPLEEAIGARIASGEFGDAISLIGRLSHQDTLDLIAASDLLVLPSHGEGSPLAVTEALTLGTPVLGTSVGAMRELIGDDGIVVGPHDPAALAQAMIDAASQREKLATWGARARSRMVEEYGWPKIAERTVDLYRGAIEHAERVR